MKEDLSNILIYSLLLADRLGINLDSAICEKILINEKKYPVEKSYGNSTKYNEI